MTEGGKPDNRLTLDAVNGLGEKDFVARFGGIYEHSPWVAEAAFGQRPFDSLTALHGAMESVVAGAKESDRLALLRAHPDLADRAKVAAGELTASSSAEQASAGLDRLSPEEMQRFQSLNAAYRERFGVPFIMAVRGADKARILAAFARRIQNAPADEIAHAVTEVGKIAWMRLLTSVVPAPTGRLTTHVLDTATGKPAAGLPIDLFRVDSDGTRESLGRFVTNADGRLDAPALEGNALAAGAYEWLFHVGVYFAGAGLTTDAPPFLDTVPLRFAIANPEAHYHVPLLLSPWSYSTYRGS